MGWIYSSVAIVAGIWFTWEGHLLYRQAVKGEIRNPMRLFHGSITHLTLLFIAVAVDPLIVF
jgi:protoheme IX farnesyltransferase